MKESEQTTDLQSVAIGVMRREITDYEPEIAFVTENITFKMRELIRVLRKNYWGIFDEPLDPQTARKKTWVPLTQFVCDTAIKNIDLDTKDINFRAKKIESIGLTAIIREVVRNNLDAIGFGEYLDELERTLSIDGTAVWKTIEGTDENGKKRVEIRLVDLLNIYIDPTSRSIAEAPSIIERAVLTKDQFMSIKGWSNKEGVNAVAGLSRNEQNLKSFSAGTPMVEVYERWGALEKYVFTGQENDKGVYVQARMVVSNVTTKPILHLLEIVGDTKRPYEEAWFSRVPGRWYGRGPAENVMNLQRWINAIINIRINRAYVAQLGIFKIRQGSGITPQMISRLAVNGALLVKTQEDIQQLPMQEASQASYNDETVINDWAQRITSSYEVATGEELPSSTPATSAVIQSRAAQSAFTFVRKGIGMFLQRWLKHQAIPIIMKNLKKTDIIRITGDADELREIDERIANELLFRRLEEMTARGEFFDTTQVEAERQRLLDKLASSGSNRYMKMITEIDPTDFDTQVYVTNEEIDKGVLVQNLMNILNTAAANPGIDIDPAFVARQIFDVMGVDAHQLRKRQPLGAPQGMLPPGMPQPGVPEMKAPPTEQQIVTAANVTV